ncbi:hypothetical protein [Campylobacter canadensis]|uniref:hypothetical protein n=1 Tax=Campylobacter canadensis TaxID=449520 RepID=UPI001CCBC961|nr:hypothetical protein [Campylobacter canadensis]
MDKFYPSFKTCCIANKLVELAQLEFTLMSFIIMQDYLAINQIITSKIEIRIQ